MEKVIQRNLTLFVKQPTYHKQLSTQQIKVLRLVCKFRFISVPILAAWLGKDKSTIYEQVAGLTKQNYLLKRYDSSYRLQLRPASYALAAKGIAYIRDTTELQEATLRNLYKNRTASDTLVVQSLAIAKLCLQLKAQYPDLFELATKMELGQSEAFLKPLSDLYLRRKDTQTTEPGSYLLERIEAGAYTWLLRKRLQAHQDWLDEHEEEWDDSYPTLLFVCGNTSTEKRIHNLVNGSYLDFEVMTVTEERVATGDRDVYITEWWDDEEPVMGGL